MLQPTPQILRKPESLRIAVKRVIAQNSSVGYNAPRFVQATLNGEAPDLLQRCGGLLVSSTALEAMLKAVQEYYGLLTLEDFVMRWGSDWGFNSMLVDTARGSSSMFDNAAGRKRWIAEGEAPVD